MKARRLVVVGPADLIEAAAAEAKHWGQGVCAVAVEDPAPADPMSIEIKDRNGLSVGWADVPRGTPAGATVHVPMVVTDWREPNSNFLVLRLMKSGNKRR